MIENFLAWEKIVEADIEHMKNILEQRLSDEPEELVGDLKDAECWNSRAGFLLADANTWLDRAEHFYQPGKEGRTEADRKAILADRVAPVRAVRDHMDTICNSIKQRLILGESILAYMRQFKAPEITQDARKTGTGIKPW